MEHANEAAGAATAKLLRPKFGLEQQPQQLL
jgi:hypothetical protein